MKNVVVDADCGLDAIRHNGIITRMDHDYYYVSIVSQSACASCHAKGACNVTDLNEEIVEVPRNGDESRSVGDQVQVAMRRSLGTKAVMLGYVFPFMIVLVTMILLVALTGNEGLAGVVSLLVLVPYYIGLHYYRNHLKRTFTFSIQ